MNEPDVPLTQDTIPHGEFIVQIARVCHQVNRAYCLSLGDASQPTWEEAPEWQKESAIDGVQFHMEHPQAGPEASHERWWQKKIEDGWTLGAVKDAELKTHPCMVLFHDLPKEQQAKDYLFQAVVHALNGA